MPCLEWENVKKHKNKIFIVQATELDYARSNNCAIWLPLLKVWQSKGMVVDNQKRTTL